MPSLAVYALNSLGLYTVEDNTKTYKYFNRNDEFLKMQRNGYLVTRGKEAKTKD